MENRASVIRKVAKYVADQFGDGSEASYRKAFDLIDADRDGACSLGEIRTLLRAAGVGNKSFHDRISREILRALDTNGDGKVGWEEFRTVFAAE